MQLVGLTKKIVLTNKNAPNQELYIVCSTYGNYSNTYPFVCDPYVGPCHKQANLMKDYQLGPRNDPIPVHKIKDGEIISIYLRR